MFEIIFWVFFAWVCSDFSVIFEKTDLRVVFLLSLQKYLKMLQMPMENWENNLFLSKKIDGKEWVNCWKYEQSGQRDWTQY